MIPKISIIIACYNDPDVEKAVESALMQTYKNKEIIVVNDGSNKSISNLIAGLSDKVDKVINQPNQGQSIARNNGIKKASGSNIF